MRYSRVISAHFLNRPNRFIARVETGDGIETVHVKNTGRCKELLVPGATVYLEEGQNPSRKTKYDLIVLAPGGISHSGPGGNRQLWPDENSQS